MIALAADLRLPRPAGDGLTRARLVAVEALARDGGATAGRWRPRGAVCSGVPGHCMSEEARQSQNRVRDYVLEAVTTHQTPSQHDQDAVEKNSHTTVSEKLKHDP